MIGLRIMAPSNTKRHDWRLESRRRIAQRVLGIWCAIAIPNEAIAADTPSCIEVLGGCLQAKFEYTHFSPDNRFLYFSYQYFSVQPQNRPALQLTSQNIARADLGAGTFSVLRSDCRLDFGNFNSSRGGRYFVASVRDRSAHNAEGPLEYLEVTDLTSSSRQRIEITENNSKLYFDPFFSSDDRTLYFVRSSRGFGVLIFAYAMEDRSTRLVFPPIIRRRVANRPERAGPPREIVYLIADPDSDIRYLARPEFLDQSEEFVFYGRFPGPTAEKRLLEPLSKITGFEVARLRATILVYSINLRTQRLDIHPVSARLDLRKLGIGAFRAVPGKGMFLLNGHYKFPPVDRVVYRVRDPGDPLEPFATVDHDGYQWFDISPDLNWIAYSHAEAIRTSIGSGPLTLQRNELVVKNRSTGAVHRLDLISRRGAFLEPYACLSLVHGRDKGG